MIQQSLPVLRAGTAEGNAKVFYGSNSEFLSICANALVLNVPYGRLGQWFTLESIANPCRTPLGPIVTSDGWKPGEGASDDALQKARTALAVSLHAGTTSAEMHTR